MAIYGYHEHPDVLVFEATSASTEHWSPVPRSTPMAPRGWTSTWVSIDRPAVALT
jgi:hypothetical protein